MKNFIKWLLILFIGLVATLLILPYVFQDKITQLVKEEINKNVDAQVDFDQVNISFLSAFPNVSLKINDLSVIGKQEFAGDTLAFLPQFQLKIGLLSILNEPIEIRSIIIEHPQIHAKVLENEKANWDIAIESEDTVESMQEEGTSPFIIRMRSFKIIAANIIYEDQSMNLLTNIDDMDFLLSGNLSSDYSSLTTQSNIKSITVNMDGISYLNKTKLEWIAEIDADLKNSEYTFKKNMLQLNALELGFDGSVAMPGEDILLDLSFEGQKTEFKHVLSLIPTIYKSDFKDIRSSGKIALKGMVKGIYNENKLPAFDINLWVNNAQFQYPDLPSKIEKVSLDLNIKNEDGIEDHTLINLKKFHMDMAGNGFDMRMMISNPISDPNIDGRINGIIDLGKLKDIIPSDNMNISGVITANIELKGKMSSIEKEDYQAFHAIGNLAVSQLIYSDHDFPEGIEISSAKANLSPQYINLEELIAKVGKSDMNMQGKIENILPYYFNDELLKGNFSFSSNLIDVSDFMGDETEESEEAVNEIGEEMSVIEIPKNIDFNLNTDITTLLYDGIEIKNVKGGLNLKDGTANMDNLQIQMLEGSLILNGQYSSQDLDKPSFNLDLDVQNLQVKKTFEAFNTIQKLAPIAKHIDGHVSAKMDISGLLLQNMEPDMESLNSNGRLQSDHISIKNADFFHQIGSLIKTDRFNQLSTAKVDLSYTMEKGLLLVKPFDTKFGNSKMTIGGSQSLDQSIDYGIDFTIPSSEFGSQANAVANQLLGGAGKFGVDLKVPENIKFKALIGGTLTAPKVSLDLKNSAGNIVDDLQKQAEQKLNEEVDKAKAKAIEEAKKQAAAIMAEADKQGKKLIAEAQKLADQAKKESYQQIEAGKAEAYKQADNLVKEAGNDPIKLLVAKKAAEKMKKEADKTAENLKKEADEQANKPVKEATSRAKQLKINAQKEGDAIVKKADDL